MLFKTNGELNGGWQSTGQLNRLLCLRTKVNISKLSRKKVFDLDYIFNGVNTVKQISRGLSKNTIRFYPILIACLYLVFGAFLFSLFFALEITSMFVIGLYSHD